VFIIYVLYKIKLYTNYIYCFFIAFLKGYCSELIVHTNAGITVKCLLSDVIFYFFSIYFFLGWNYLCLSIEPLFELSIFTAVDKVKDRILYNKVWKDNWTYWYTCQYYIIYCSIGTIWVHFKRNHNLFDQVLINVITFVLFYLYLNHLNYFLF
jgi:hypothetical protein